MSILKGLAREVHKKWKSKEMDPVEMEDQGVKRAGQEHCHDFTPRKFRTLKEVAEGKQVRKWRHKSWGQSITGPSHEKSFVDFGIDSGWDGIQMGATKR